MSTPETREIARIEDATLRGYAIESAEQDVAAMVLEITDYLMANCLGDRTPSKYFGPINNTELLRISFKLDATKEQIVEASANCAAAIWQIVRGLWRGWWRNGSHEPRTALADCGPVGRIL